MPDGTPAPPEPHQAPPEPHQLRLAYFITSYGPGVQLLRLVRTLRAGDPDAAIVVHHDELSNPVERAALEALGAHVLLSEESIGWGDMTLETARWRVFRWILAELDVDWVMLLSEQDYPVAPLATLHDRIAATRADVIMSAVPIEEIEDPGLRAEADLRYRYQYTVLPRRPVERRLPAAVRPAYRRLRGSVTYRLTKVQKRFRLYGTVSAMDMPYRFGTRDDGSVITDAYPAWFNNCWFALSTRAMRHVLDTVDRRPDVVAHFARTMIPVEAATATIIGNDPGLVIEQADLHTIRWSDPTTGRPDEFGVDDVPFLVASGGPFARKFAAGDPAVYDALDRTVLETSQEHA